MQNLIFLDLQNFPLATYMTNKWPQSNKLVKLRNETLCTNITRRFPFLNDAKIKSPFCVDNFCALIALKTKKLNNLCVTQTPQLFKKHSSNFANFSFDVQWQLLDNDCRLGHGVRRAPWYVERAPTSWMTRILNEFFQSCKGESTVQTCSCCSTRASNSWRAPWPELQSH